MSTIGSTVLTLADWAKRVDPNGKVPSIVEILNQTNEVLTDMLWKEGNLPTGERCTIRSGLPSPTWRLLNKGVQTSKSTTAQVDFGCGMLEDYSEVDVALANLNGNTAAFRLSEAQAHLEGMNQEMAGTIFNGNAASAPEEFSGFAANYKLSSDTNGQNVILAGAAGGQTDCTSIYLVVWGANTVHGIFPKGSKAGLAHSDKGQVTLENAGGVSGARMEAYRDHWKWDCGLAIRDWRFVVRIANIDTSILAANTAPAKLPEFMIKALHRIPSLGMGKAAFYMNRTASEYLDIQRYNNVTTGGGLTYENVDGKTIMGFRGIPIRTCDAILNNETAIS